MTGPVTLPALLARRAASDGARPLVTTLEPGGGRVELSATTTANWVAKTAGLLRDELDVGPGDVVAVRLPLHWQTLVVLLAAWSLEAVVDVAGPLAPDVAVVVSGPDAAVPDLPPGALWLVTGLHPLGASWPAAPAGSLDLGAEVLAMPDELGAPPPAPGAAALRPGPGDGPLDAAGLLAGAAARAAAHGLGTGDRVLTALPPATPAGLWDGLLAPLAAGAAVVLLAGDAPPAAATAEGVTATVGCDLPGARRLV